MASANNGACAEGYASRSAAGGRQSASADSSGYVASVPRPRASQEELCACHAQLLVYAYVYIMICMYVCVCIYIQIYMYMYMYVHTPVVAQDMHKVHPVTLWVEEHLRRMHLNRRRLLAYLPIGFSIPLRMHHCLQLPWQPLFAMQALFALPASKKIAVRNRSCRCVPFPETRAEIKRSSFLAIQASITRNLCSTMTKTCHVVEYKIQVSRCSDTHRQV